MVTADRPFIHLDSGSSAHCYSDGQTVLKIARIGQSQKLAEARLQQFKDVLEQEYITGRPLRQYLRRHIPAIQDFFGRSLKMYRATGLVPDLLPDIMPDPTGGMLLTGKYHYRSSANVLMIGDKPVLIDTILNRSLRNRVTGSLLSALVARRIKSLL